MRIGVFRAIRKEKTWAVALSREQLVRLRPECTGRGWKITSSIEQVPRADGTVYDWEREGGCGGKHVHWLCPHCGQQHISDFDQADSNPALWFCESGGGKLCLVHWQPAGGQSK